MPSVASVKKDLERLFTGRIEDEFILCTDSHKSYIRFVQNSGVELQQIKRGKQFIFNYVKYLNDYIAMLYN